MSTVTAAYIDQVVWVVKITLSKKDNSGTVTYYLGHDYYNVGQLYAGSEIVYPVLAGNIDSIDITRSVGREVAILQEPRLQIHGKMHLDDYGKSFADLSTDYNLHEAIVEFRCYYKKHNAIGTHSDAVNIRLANVRVKNVAWNDDVLELGCRQVLFKDKEVSRRLDVAVLPDTPTENLIGEYLPIAFGSGVVVESTTVRSYFPALSTQPQLELFLSWTATGHPINAFNTLYVKNQDSSIDPEDWLPVIISGGNPYHGNRLPLATGLYNLDNAVCVVFSPGPGGAVVASSIGVILSKLGSPVSTDGELTVRIYQAQDFLPISGTWQTTKLLYELKSDAFTGSGLIEQKFACPPIVMTPNGNYLIEYLFSEPRATAGFQLTKTSAGANPNDNCQERDNGTPGAGWGASNADPNIGLYIMQQFNGLTDNTGQAPNRYSFFSFIDYNSGFTQNSANTLLDRGVSYKVSINGLEDDTSGTYTGTANAIIQNPSDLIRFLLLEDEIGANIGAGSIDTTKFTTARTKTNADGLAMSFAVESETFAQELILRICSQARLIFYVTQAGKIAAHYPLNPPAAADYYLDQSLMQDDLDINALVESNSDAILNDFLVPFGPDKLNVPKDPAVIRRNRGSSYKGSAYLNDTESSLVDAQRIARAARSVALYGRRNYRAPAELYPATSSGPAKLMQYLFDRWHNRTSTAVVRVPAVDYSATDLFDDISIRHERLNARNGTFKRLRCHNAGTEVFWYSSSVPLTLCGQGGHYGQTIGVRHIGDEIELLVETVNPFEESPA